MKTRGQRTVATNFFCELNGFAYGSSVCLFDLHRNVIQDDNFRYDYWSHLCDATAIHSLLHYDYCFCRMMEIHIFRIFKYHFHLAKRSHFILVHI